jgi:hypothetical protein
MNGMLVGLSLVVLLAGCAQPASQRIAVAPTYNRSAITNGACDPSETIMQCDARLQGMPTAPEETACGEKAIAAAQLRFEMIGGGSFGQEQGAVRDAVANCPTGTTIVMLRKFAGEHCDLSKSVVDTGYGRVACVKR